MTNPLAAPFPLTHKRPAPLDREQVWLVALSLAFGVLFFAMSHSLNYTQTVTYDFAPSSADSANAVAEGNTIRKIGYLAIGGIGLFLLLRREGRPFRFSDPLAISLLAYWAYCLASTVWSVEPSLTLKRGVVLSCCLLAVFGFVRQMRREDIVRMAFFCSFAFILAGLAAEIALGAFRPWASGYRFSGTVHPNSQGQLCAMLCLAGYAWFRQATRGRWWLLAAIGFGLALLLLTKSRTSCLAVGIGLLAIWLPFARWDRAAAASFAAPFLISLAVFAAAIAGFDIESGVSSTLTLGRDESVGSFTGRVPLWKEVAPHILDRPILGHGYMSFWTPWRIEHMSELLDWTIPDAHNEYIETFLSLGLAGALLLGAVVFGGLARCYRSYLRTADPCLGFFAAQLLIALVGGVFESGFAQPLGFVSFVTVCGLAYVACRTRSAPDRAATPSAAQQPHPSGASL